VFRLRLFLKSYRGKKDSGATFFDRFSARCRFVYDAASRIDEKNTGAEKKDSFITDRFKTVLRAVTISMGFEVKLV